MLSITMLAIGVPLAHSGIAWGFGAPWTSALGIALCLFNPAAMAPLRWAGLLRASKATHKHQ